MVLRGTRLELLAVLMELVGAVHMGSVGLYNALESPYDDIKNQTIPVRLPPGLKRTVSSDVHQERGVKHAAGAPAKIRGTNKITTGTWNTRTL